MKFKNKKGATSISVTLMVIMTLVLVGFALFSFYTRKTYSEEFLSQNFEEVYAKEIKINFYLDKGIFSSGAYEEYFEELERAVNSVANARLVGNEVEIMGEYEGMKVTYKFKPKSK